MLLCRLSGDEGGDPGWAEVGQNVLCSSTLWFSWAVLTIRGRGVVLGKIEDSGGESWAVLGDKGEMNPQDLRARGREREDLGGQDAPGGSRRGAACPGSLRGKIDVRQGIHIFS